MLIIIMHWQQIGRHIAECMQAPTQVSDDITLLRHHAHPFVHQPGHVMYPYNAQRNWRSWWFVAVGVTIRTAVSSFLLWLVLWSSCVSLPWVPCLRYLWGTPRMMPSLVSNFPSLLAYMMVCMRIKLPAQSLQCPPFKSWGRCCKRWCPEEWVFLSSFLSLHHFFWISNFLSTQSYSLTCA